VLAVGSWIPALGITLGHGYTSIVALAFALVGAYAGAFAGRWLNREANNAD
jgi:phage tail tape-measure protein